MNDFPWLTALMVVPLVGAVVTAALPTRATVAPQAGRLGFSLLTLVLAVVMASRCDPGHGGRYQYTETHEWIDVFGAHYALGVDGIGLILVLLTTVLVPVVIGASWFDADHGNTKALLRLGARAAGLVDRRVHRDRRLPLLRPVRGHAGPGVLPDRRVRPRGPARRPR